MFIKGDIKSGTTDEAVQEQCFLLDSGASVSSNFGFLNFQDKLQAQKQQRRAAWRNIFMLIILDIIHRSLQNCNLSKQTSV